MVGLSAIHHSFLQSMMTCGALSTDDTKKLYNKCVQNDQGSRAAELQDVGDLKGQIYIINKYAQLRLLYDFALHYHAN